MDAAIIIPGIGKVLKLKLSAIQKSTIELLLTECERHGVADKKQIAYVLATCYHECRYKPISEIRAKPGTKIWKWQNRYWPSGFYGRGYSQLTWRKNYRKFSPIVGVNLEANPDQALRPEIGAKILVYGMANGTFVANGLTSKTRLSTFLNDGEPDWLGARAIVNGSFEADKVADAAIKIMSVIG